MWPKRSAYFIVLTLIVLHVKNAWSLSDKRLCADPECKEIISFAKGKIKYMPAEKGKIPFGINSIIRVKSKSAGSDPSLWGIEVNGRQGYAPKELILEQKILIKDENLKYEVPVESWEDPAKQAIEIPSAKLQPSEIIVEEKVKPTDTPLTDSLDVSETSATPSPLNASENEVETTTVPLTVENEVIVKESLREIVTPVQNSYEIIDGTALPIVEEVTTKEPIYEADIVTGNESEETATTKTVTRTMPKFDDNQITTNEITAAAKQDVKFDNEQIKEKDADATKVTGGDALKHEKSINDVVAEENSKGSEMGQSKKSIVESIVKTQEEIVPNVMNINKQNSESTKDSAESKTIDSTEKANMESMSAGLKMETDNEVPSSTSEIKAKDDVLVKEVPNMKTIPTGSNTPSMVFKTEENSQKQSEEEKYHLNDADDDDEEDEENEEDEEDEVDMNEEDIEANDITIPSASFESTTTEPTTEITDSGYDTYSNKNYWENLEETTTTTPTPKVFAEEVPKTQELKQVGETTTKIAEKATITNENLHTSTEMPDSSFTNPTIEAVETTIKSNQEVPSIPTTLPIFNQPTVPPIPEEQQNKESVVYDNSNRYYHKEEVEQNTETDNLEHLPQKPVEHSTESTVLPPLPVLYEEETSTEHTHTGLAQEESEKSESVVKNDESANIGTATIEMVTTQTLPPEQHIENPMYTPKEEKREAGLFTTILGTVNTFVNKLRKDPQKTEYEAVDKDEELQRILYPDRFATKNKEQSEQFCEKLDPHHCPQLKQRQEYMSTPPLNSFENHQCHYEWSHINMDNFVEIFVSKAFEMREFLSCMAIAASSSLLFLFGYYCFCNSNREGALISKLNQLERSLLASHKENAILKDDLLKTRLKLTSIEDNSFGSNDMVIALKKELDSLSTEKQKLQEHVHSLEKELETAAEAGLELNKIIADLLNNQSGQESMIMNSVEDLQMQFNEQQKTILEINANLAEKSRENSELQLMLAEQNARFNGEIASLQQDNDELEAEKASLQTRIEELKSEFDEDIKKALEGKNVEIKRLQNEVMDLKNRCEDIHTKWQTSLAKIEALEDCMKTIKRDPSANISEIMNAANVKAELLDLQQQRASLKSLLETETEARKHAEKSLKNTILEVDKLKQEFHQSEKDKLEAQTRLEVLSNYFKEKETQLQKELSLKEAIWLKQQGENSSTVDRMTTMQEEIQSLKSQNDALRAEIEAQIAAHKAQIGTLENRAHETWLAARQSERRYEEACVESAALRRKLTELATITNPIDGNRTNVDSKMTTNELNNAHSPIMPTLLESAGSPLLGRLPPPQLLPFIGPPPPPFLNLPAPPFLSSAKMRPAPLGRMMSPPLGRYLPPPAQTDRDRSDYDDDDYDYEDGDDYDIKSYDYAIDDDDMSRHRLHRRRSGNGSDSWRRDNYSPPPTDRSYRSHSPADSRYNYTYDTETDLSPPPSPPNVVGGLRKHSTDPATKEPPASVKKSGKGVSNSGSEKSYNFAQHNTNTKSMV